MKSVPIPEGLVNLVSRVLGQCVGHEKAITLPRMLQLIHESPLYRTVNGRQVRGAIEELREAGSLICNDFSGTGYFTAGFMSEYQSFRVMYASYAITIFSRCKQMDEQAERQFKTNPLQERLI